MQDPTLQGPSWADELHALQLELEDGKYDQEDLEYILWVRQNDPELP